MRAKHANCLAIRDYINALDAEKGKSQGLEGKSHPFAITGDVASCCVARVYAVEALDKRGTFDFLSRGFVFTANSKMF